VSPPRASGYHVVEMLTSGAAALEALVVWLYWRGSPMWLAAVAAIVGFGFLLALDWLVDRRGSASTTAQ
jgi:hypothetical protein